ncbi:hypothetical protein CLOHAE12215_02244 [Clostridium haemolyticum]|uniref:hypothetical protein n=1 Tax=Clostridium haemolyticum TaxID=84025 RepID=UPI001C3B56D0|nr:hypothetical protein [Clostridium haemolyticum]CAG7840820.1 hypothetical protein CLOHAE12215_02244 [Clostridium haemolyticum]
MNYDCCNCFRICNQYVKRKKIIYICKCQYQYFLSKSNVVGVGLGYKDIDGICTYEECIKVFVTEKISKNEIPPKDRVPAVYQGIKTDVVTGGVSTECKLVNRIRPTLCGYAIGVSYGATKSITTGTLGCLVKDEENIYILGSGHVLTGENIIPLGTPITQPSIPYGGIVSRDTVAHLSKFIPLRYISSVEVPENYVDCAIGKVIARSLVIPEISILHKPPLGVSTAKLKQKVIKVGAISEETTGIVESLNTTIYVKYNRGEVLLKDQIITTKMSTKGDSGSLLLDCAGNAIGLLHSDSENNSNYCDISNVLRMLNVSLVTK